nr:SUKH-4 family immunity protein [Streptomyces sp. SID14478]
MAWSRGDFAFASSVASSGVSLPWRAKWAHWRLPGGFHARFLEAGRFVRLAEVRWEGRAAVAGLQQRAGDGSPEPYVSIRDVETGEVLAGPWEQGDLPAEHGTETLPPKAAAATAASSGAQDGEGSGRLTRLAQLFGASSPPRDKRAFLLPCAPLTVDDVVLFGGDLGLIALQSANGAIPSDTFGSRRRPLSWDYADAGPSTPVDAAPSSHRDLTALFGEDDIFEAEPEEFPDRLTHQKTRDLLTGFGLPDMDEGAMALLPYGDGEIELFDEVDWPDAVEPVAERGPFFQIGMWMGGGIVVDGPTGRILRVPTGTDEEQLSGLPAARSLESFLAMVALWVTGLRTRELLPPGSSERGQITYWVLGALTGVDAAGGAQPAWSYVLHNE